MTRAVFYGRYSSDRQTEDSIKAQRRAVEAYAKANGIKIVAEYVDEAISGKGSKTASRTAYQDMLRACDNGDIDMILIHKYDRVARDAEEHHRLDRKLRDKGITLIATSEDYGTSNGSKVMKGLAWLLSEHYLDNLRDETRKGHKEVALKGLHNGGVAPFGYNIVDQKYVINEFEAGYVRKMFDAVVSRAGFTDLIAEMEAAGVRGKRGKIIKYPQIYEIVRNEKYTGVYIYCPTEQTKRENRRTKTDDTAIRVEGAIPAIITKKQFEEVQAIMTARKQVGRGKTEYLCRGLVYCTCGEKMHGSTTTGKGHTYRRYTCSAQCGIGIVKMDDINNAATAYLAALLSPENQQEIILALRKYQTGESNRARDFNAGVKRQIADKQSQYDKLMDKLATEGLPSEITVAIGQRMQTLKNEISELEVVKPPQEFTKSQIEAWLESLRDKPDEKAIQILIERIDVITKTDFNITSTLKSVLGINESPTTGNPVVGEIGCGDRI